MTDEDVIVFLDQWDKLDEATRQVLVSKPVAMTAAAERLDKERRLMAAMIRAMTISTKRHNL